MPEPCSLEPDPLEPDPLGLLELETWAWQAQLAQAQPQKFEEQPKMWAG